MLPNLLTQPLAYGVPVESNQRAPKPIEVFRPLHECRSAPTILRDRALEVRYGLLQHRNRQASSTVIVQHQAARSTCSHARTLVFDTLSGLARLSGDSENNAGVATETMAPLQDAAAEGFAVLVPRHERKSGGTIGESARGSSAFGGSVDVMSRFAVLRARPSPRFECWRPSRGFSRRQRSWWSNWFPLI
jgi:hypothetical protein